MEGEICFCTLSVYLMWATWLGHYKYFGGIYYVPGIKPTSTCPQRELAEQFCMDANRLKKWVSKNATGSSKLKGNISFRACQPNPLLTSVGEAFTAVWKNQGSTAQGGTKCLSVYTGKTSSVGREAWLPATGDSKAVSRCQAQILFRAPKSLQCGELLPQCQELNSVPQYYNCLILNRESGSLLDSLLSPLSICPLNKHVLISSWYPIFIGWWACVSLLESLIAVTWSSASTSLLYCWWHWAGKRKDEIIEKDRRIDLLAALSELSSSMQMNTENHSGSRFREDILQNVQP